MHHQHIHDKKKISCKTIGLGDEEWEEQNWVDCFRYEDKGVSNKNIASGNETKSGIRALWGMLVGGLLSKKKKSKCGISYKKEM